MRKERIIVLALAVLAGLVVLVARPAPVVEVRTVEGRVLVRWPLVEGQVLALVFTHSMYGGDVREVYRVDARRGLTLVEVTARQAVLDYYALPVSTGTGEYRTVTVERPLGAIWVRADRIGQHRLAYGDYDVSLVETAGDGVAIWVGVVQLSRGCINDVEGVGWVDSGLFDDIGRRDASDVGTRGVASGRCAEWPIAGTSTGKIRG